MDALAQVMMWVVAGLVLGQTALLVGYVLFLYRFRRPLLKDGECPRAAVILCVRGVDPFLSAALKGLFTQDYPDYEVYVVVDSLRDPAWPFVNNLARQYGRGNIRILTLTDRLATSSRKIAGVLQAMNKIDASREIVALLDADTIPHATWLRELAAPLRDPRVGVSSGNRWYMPSAATPGSLVRYLWNAAAVVQMYWYKIGWGGSLALSTRFLRESDLTERLAMAFGEDSTICRCALHHGYRIAFAPSLVMVNRETCGVRSVAGFLERQLLTVRLHNPWWWAVVGHGVSTTASLALCAVLGIAAAATSNGQVAGMMAGSLAGYWAAMALMLVPLEWCARRVVLARGEPIVRRSVRDWLRTVLMIPLAQAVQFGAIVKAMRARDHLWRGVKYHFYGASPVQVVEDAAEAA